MSKEEILIALDDGHGMDTAGKRTPHFPDGTVSPDTGKKFMHENEFNRAVVKYLDEELRRCGFKTLLVAPTDEDTPLSVRVKRANDAKADFYLSVHANAFKGVWGDWGGTSTFIYGKEGTRVGKILHKHLMKGTPLRDRGTKDGSWLYVQKHTNMGCTLVECAFMDNLKEAKLLITDEFRRECARELAMGLCEAYNVKYVPKPEITEWYRVRLSWTDVASQKGAFRDLENAKLLADELKDEGDYRVFDEKGNMVYDPTPVKQDDIWYRVRKSWEDIASQKGAFHELEGAKKCADENAKDGYKVFDEDGKVVYEPKTEEPKPEVDSHEGHHDIMGKIETTSVDKMVAFVREINPNAQDIEEIVNQFVKVGEKYNVRGDIALCQSIIETGWFEFDGGTAVTPDQHNYCGMGVTSKGMKGNSFETIEEGVTAQIQHLYAYACKEDIPNGEFIVDPRFKYVKRGIAPHWEDLSNKWAMNKDYGKHILALYSELVEYEYTPQPEEIITPEPTPQPQPEPTPEPTPIKEEIKDDRVNFWLKIIEKIAEVISNIFKK